MATSRTRGGLPGIARLHSSGRRRRRRIRALWSIANRPPRCLVAACGAAQRKTLVFELEEGLVPENSADGTSHKLVERSKAGCHRVAPVAEAGFDTGL